MRTRTVITRLRHRVERRRGEQAHARRPQGLGAPPAAAHADADDAELDSLRGELVRELDRMASGTGGAACFRRI